MRTVFPIFAAIAIFFSEQGFGQQSSSRVHEIDLDEAMLTADNFPVEGREIVAYHVEERINTKFGAYVTSYTVADPKYIRRHELGPDNTRTITPKYGKPRQKLTALNLVRPLVAQTRGRTPSASIPEIGVKTAPKVAAVEDKATAPAESKPAVAYINTTDTYERILKKGYKSVEMLRRVANSRFFDGDYAAAAHWYEELFSLTKDLDDAYYFRYAQSLKSIGQPQKAAELMATFESRIASK